MTSIKPTTTLPLETPASSDASTPEKNRVFMNKSGLLELNANSEEEAVKKLSQEFESVFMGIVLKSMRDTVPEEGLINGGNGESVFRSMLDEEYSKSMAKQGGSGLAEMIEKQMLSQRGIKPTISPTALRSYQDLALKR